MKVLAILTLAGVAAAAAIPAPDTDKRDAEVEAREPTISFLDSVQYKREAEAEAEASPDIKFLNSVHYKREAEAEAEAEAGPDIKFLNSVHYKREAEAEAEADPDIKFLNSVHYKRDDQCADLDVPAPAAKREADLVLRLLDAMHIRNSKREAEAEPAINFPDSTHYRKF